MSTDPSSAPAFVVALGASADGLDAIERFFLHCSPRTGMTFVVIQHLAPDAGPLLEGVLTRCTAMPVRVAEHGVALAPDTVYVSPPGKLLSLRDHRFELGDRPPGPAATHSIDQFFQAMAADAPGRCAAIVLSGTGSDGSRGIADVSLAGGLVIAQRPATAGFDGMPAAAIDTGRVDLVLAPEDMPEALRLHREQGSAQPPAASAPRTGLARLVGLLSEVYGVDFSEYKLATIVRRTEHRMKACGAADLDDYLARLSSDPAELDALYRDLLIGVTQFFRDPEAFERIAGLLPEQLRAIAPDEEFRVWVVGCASGEEAYSMAIAGPRGPRLRSAGRTR